MAYFPTISLLYNDSPVSEDNPLITAAPDRDYDAFARFRVSQGVTLFDSQFSYDDQPFLWQTVISGGGSATYSANLAAVILSGISIPGAAVIRQTYEYFRYQPGKAQSIIMTGVMGLAPNGTTKRIGYFDGRNGLYFAQISGINYIGLRTDVNGPGSGTVSPGFDTIIPQSAWNLDKMDGSGPSGLTLDITKAQIFMIDFQWLGTGRVRFGFDGHPGPVYVHEIFNANINSTVYMNSPNLPLRYEIINDVGGSTTTMQQICSSVISEGGVEIHRGIFRSASTRNVTATISNTLIPILSIRPRSRIMTGSGFSNSNGLGYRNRVQITPHHAAVWVTTSDNIYWSIRYNATLSGATWVAPVASGIVEACVEVDIAATAVTGGMSVQSGALIQNTGRESFIALMSRLPFALDYSGNPAGMYTLCAQNFIAASASVGGEFHWQEYY